MGPWVDSIKLGVTAKDMWVEPRNNVLTLAGVEKMQKRINNIYFIMQVDLHG